MSKMLYDGGNFAVSKLRYDISPSATSLHCVLGDGNKFPDPGTDEFFFLTLEKADGSAREVVKVTSRSDNVFTIARGQDGTSAQSWLSGATLEMRLNDGFFDYFLPRWEMTEAAAPNMVPVLGSEGLLDPDMIPTVKSLTEEGAYGFRHDPVNNTFLTIGGSTSPVHEAIRGVVLDDDTGAEVYELLSTDFRRKDTPATTGTADGTTTDHLIDSTTNFSSDTLVNVGDYVYNSTSGDFAQVTAVADGDLTLDADIFVSGNEYEIGANLTGTDGQVTIAFPKCWTGVFHQNGYDYYLVADKYIPGLKVHDAFFVGATGDHPRDYRYMGKYQAVWCDDGVYKDHDSSTAADTAEDHIASVSGFTPITDQTRATFRTLADNTGTGNKYWSCDMHLQHLAMLLHYTAPGIRDAANPFYSYDNVPGHTEESGWDYANTKASGLTNSLGLTDGSITDGGIVVANNILGIENLFGSIWEWRDGININDHMPYMCSNPANFADDVTTNYEQVLDQYGSVVLMPNTNQYQKSWHAGTMFPSSVHSVSSTFITDYYWQNPGWRVARVGGASSAGALAGVAALAVHSASGYSGSVIGGRLAA